MKAFIASPLIYNQKAKLIEETPQIHKRKASFGTVVATKNELTTDQSLQVNSITNETNYIP